jgi:hypothetical protein
MAQDELALLLERAAGADPGDGDVGDVRRRARRYAQRRRVVSSGVVVVVAAVGLLVAGQRGPDRDAPAVVASDMPPPVPGEVLFERRLSDGSMLRVSRTDDPTEVAVELSGVAEPVGIPIRSGTITVRPGDESVPWDVATMVPCPGDETRVLRAWKDDGTSDTMALDGIGVVAVPRSSPSRASESADDQVVVVEADSGSGEVTLHAEASGSDDVTYVDLVDASGRPLRPGTMVSSQDADPGAVLGVPVGPIEELPAGLIPQPADPAQPCG